MKAALVAFNSISVFVVAVVGGFFLGWWLDGKLGTTPGFTLGLCLIGTAAATYVVIRDMRRWMK